MHRFEIPSTPLTWLMALVLTAVVAGCGGGGGGGTAAMTSVDGIGAFGKPIIGGTVQMVCANNAAGTAIATAATGAFTVTAPGSAPCVIRISGGNLVGGPFYSIFAAGQTRANVNQLTTMLAFLLADGNPETFFTSSSTISTKITTAAVATDQETVRASVIANLAGAVTPAISTSFDFLQTAFTANSTGFDQMLDKLGFASVGNTSASITFNGAPLLAVNPTSNVASTTTSTLITSVTLAAAGASGTAGIPGTVLPGASATNTVISSNPANNATNVPTSTSGPGAAPIVTGKLVTATFSQAMDPLTVTPIGTFTLVQTVAGTNVLGTVTMNAANTIATFTPAGALLVNTQYTAMVGTAAKSAIAPGPTTAMPNPVSWKFTTAAALTTGQSSPDIGTASTYGVFASAAAVSLAGTAVVNGDVGLNPAGACGGCTVGVSVIGGVIHNGDAAAIQAQTDFNSAYMDASIRATNACAITGDLSAAQGACGAGFSPGTPGPIYGPGLYRTATAIGLSGSMTLDAGGNPDAVFIFQSNTAITTATNSTVILANGAKAKNVWWIAGSAATLGVSSTFNGTVIANGAAVTVLGGTALAPTTVTGRMFSHAAGVTVNTFATVTVPQ